MTKYQLTLSQGSVFLLYGMKRPWNFSANYLITQNSKTLDKQAPGYLGKTRSNWDGTLCICFASSLIVIQLYLFLSKDADRFTSCFESKLNHSSYRAPIKLSSLIYKRLQITSNQRTLFRQQLINFELWHSKKH